LLRSIPSPTISAIEIGPLTFHFYALCIMLGITVAIWLGNRRFLVSAPHGKSVVSEVAITAVPFGIVGGRIYHVITSPDAYFGSGGHPIDAFKIWEGGLGIWGAISLGTFAAWFRYRSLAARMDLPSFSYFMDALAPGILFAQAIGRFGNWFNVELFGRPLDAPWALSIPMNQRPIGYTQFETFHPTFLYEAVWATFLAIILMRVGVRLHSGQVFSLYIAGYCLGRIAIESIRIDEAQQFFGLRLNVLVGIVIGVSAMIVFLRQNKEPSENLR
jgi:prolipoprotein diacylglyceryl transferase